MVEPKEHGGSMSMIRFNHLQPPFDNPAIRRAFFPGIKQSDYMMSVMGDDHSLWNDRCGFFLPGGPFSTEAGLDVMTARPTTTRCARTSRPPATRASASCSWSPPTFPR